MPQSYYEDLLFQRQRRSVETTKRELNFLEHAFRADATRPIKDVLDIACGSGRHVFGLASRGYKCTGLDYSPERVQRARNVIEDRAPGICCTEIVRLRDFDPMHGVAWWDETSTIEASDGIHVFSDRERLPLFTYWDILHYLQASRFKMIKCYTNRKIKPPQNRKAETLIFIARKD